MPVRQAFRERHADIAERFDRSLQSSNEYYTIALRLARTVGTERIHPVDAHREKGPLLAMLESDPTIEAFFERVFGDFSEHPFAKEGKRRKEEAVEAGDLLPYYRWLNDPTTTQRDVDFQWAPFLEKDDESRFGKARLALWEQRNLLMAANIARVLAEYPGKTAVFIVGSGHKPFIDDYFETASWVELLRADEVLGTADSSAAATDAYAPRDSEGQAIAEAYAEWVQATNDRDLEAWAAFLAPNPIFLPADGPALTDREAILDYYEDLFADDLFALDCRQQQVEVAESEDLALASGRCEASFTGADGRLAHGSSTWVKVWKRQPSGAWKCVANSWGSI